MLSHLFSRPVLLLATSTFLTTTAFLSGCGGGGGGGSRSPQVGVSGLRVACVGDSITYGAGTSSPNNKAYPAVLSNKLGSRNMVVNFGVSGAQAVNSESSSYRSTSNYRRALEFKPNVVVMCLGTNDAGRTQAAIRAYFKNDFTSMIGAFKRANPAVKIYLCRPPASNPSGNKPLLETEILPRVQQLAEENGTQIIDVYGATTGKPELYSDSTHLNDAGASVMAETVLQALVPPVSNSVSNPVAVR